MDIKKLDKHTLEVLIEQGVLTKDDIEKLMTNKDEDTNRLSVLESVNRFIDYLGEDFSKNTISGYKTNIESFLQYHFEVDKFQDLSSYQLSGFSVKDVKTWFEYLSENGYTGSSIRRFKHSLKSYFNFLSGLGYAEPNLDTINIDDELNEIYALTQEEVYKMAECCKSIRDKAMILFMYETGMRRQELIDCKKSHIDFRNNLVHILSAKGEIDRVGYFTDMVKCVIKEHIDNWVEEVKEINLKRQKRVREKGGVYKELIVSDYLFQTPRSQQVSYSTIFKVIKETAQEYFQNKLVQEGCSVREAEELAIEKSENVNTETLRHSRRAYLYSIGKSTEQIQVVMGDENRWVVKRYLKVSQKLYPECFRM